MLALPVRAATTTTTAVALGGSHGRAAPNPDLGAVRWLLGRAHAAALHARRVHAEFDAKHSQKKTERARKVVDAAEHSFVNLALR